MRQIPNLRKTARGRPHNLQRFSRRVENFGSRFAFAILLLLATAYASNSKTRNLSFIDTSIGQSQLPFGFRGARKGMPSNSSNWNASSFVLAVVTTVMFIP